MVEGFGSSVNILEKMSSEEKAELRKTVAECKKINR
jgi:hypothetical protein